MHNPRLTYFAGKDTAHNEAIKVGKGMALLALRVVTVPDLIKAARVEFELPPEE